MTAEKFGMFDGVKLRVPISTTDIYGEWVDFRQGKQGCVIEAGKERDSYIVEFKVGRGMRAEDFTSVEVSASDLTLVFKVGKDSRATESV